jgi:SAM-dependent methyltransferase
MQDDPGYLWHPRNPVSLYYRQAQERAVIDLINRFRLPIEGFKLLDIGCGKGIWIRFLASLGVDPKGLYGLDLVLERIQHARMSSPPDAGLLVGNAEALPFTTGFFDMVWQFVVFSSIFDDYLRSRIGSEIVRVLRPGGYILWYDLRRGDNLVTRDTNPAGLRSYFPGCELLYLKRLHPPYATRLAGKSIFLCEMLDRIPGMPKTHALALLQKG